MVQCNDAEIYIVCGASNCSREIGWSGWKSKPRSEVYCCEAERVNRVSCTGMMLKPRAVVEEWSRVVEL